jgi:NTE family protein
MQGGGYLGAYECGVYKTLEKHGIKLDIVAGTSIGAAIIVGSKTDSPAQDLEHFWLTLADNITPSSLPNNIRSIHASMFAAIYGNSRAFEPIWFSFPYLIYNYSSSISSTYAIPHLYDTMPLKNNIG